MKVPLRLLSLLILLQFTFATTIYIPENYSIIQEGIDNFVNGDFTLQLNSPCIDAGDPNSPLDPDGTIADMGAFYFDQSSNCTYSGDLNDDDTTDILDIVLIINQIMGVNE
jgi:hypothetical protein